MKRKLKITGLAVLLVSLFSAVVHSAASGSIGFGIFLILCFFAAVFSVIGLFILSWKQYRLWKKYLTSDKPVQAEKKEKEEVSS